MEEVVDDTVVVNQMTKTKTKTKVAVQVVIQETAEAVVAHGTRGRG